VFVRAHGTGPDEQVIIVHHTVYHGGGTATLNFLEAAFSGQPHHASPESTCHVRFDAYGASSKT
jgi:hypothetical protein